MKKNSDKNIIKFSEIKKGDVGLVGGKGLSLGLMLKNGINVPNGFVVTTKMFEEFLKKEDLDIEIDKILSQIKHGDMANVDEASQKIRGLILNIEFSKQEEKEIQEYFSGLNSEFVAVRSSATAEDGKDHAWAGQLDSFLNTAKVDLLKNIKKCFASLFSPRAIFYRFEKKLENKKISVAVVVQEMIQAEVSGVAFSTHPITNDKKSILIEAGYGLGEAIVSGAITPDSYVVNKKSLEIMDKNVHKQERGLYLSGGKNGWKEIKLENQQKQKLSNSKIYKLVKLICGVEKYFGFPCDIEWAFVNDAFYIMQSRPITTLSKEKVKNNSFLSKEEIRDLKEKYKFINVNSYDFLWRVYVYFPFTYLLWQGDYNKHDFIFTYLNGEYMVFVSKKERRNLSEKTFKIYLDNFETFEKRSVKLIEETDRLFKAQWEKDFTKLSNQEFLDEYKFFRKTSLKILKGYFPLDVHSMDKAGEMLVSGKHPEHSKLIKNSDKLGHLKLDMRAAWDPLVGHPYLLGKFVEEFGRRLNLGSTYNAFESKHKLDELYKSLLRGADLKSKEERLGGMVWGKRIKKALVGKKAKLIIDQLWQVNEDDTQIKGQIGNGGLVRGFVKKIDFEDYDNETYLSRKFEEMVKGDILVVGSTSPDFIPACKKASAIVTDEGGIISHAAIISRELGIPCVMGTKTATYLLNDGDEILVDANNGVVKIINKNKS